MHADTHQSQPADGERTTQPSPPPALASASSSSSLSIDMADTPQARASLPTSLVDFALPVASTSILASPGGASAANGSHGSPLSRSAKDDDSLPLMKRMHRPPYCSGWLSEGRLHSPLSSSSFTVPTSLSMKGKERCRDDELNDTVVIGGEFRDKDRMTTDSSSPSSESDIPTPPFPTDSSMLNGESLELSKSSSMDMSRSNSPASTLKPALDIQDASPRHVSRRTSCPLKVPRLLSLRAEARPDESEVKSEAQFQRLLASFSGLPPGLGNGRSPKTASNRGRYPEEAVEDAVFEREETPSDDGEPETDELLLASSLNYKVPTGTDPINIAKPSTPVPSLMPTSFGTPDDWSSRFISESPGQIMDIDVPALAMGSPAVTSSTVPPHQWRQTPPPTASTSALRTAKRKYEDRFDPYAPSSKRRAVSPSISHLKDRDIVSPIIIPRSPILRPRKSFSQSQTNSAASSPTISQNPSLYIQNLISQNTGNGHHRSGSSSSAVSSPTVRSLVLASPILRPIPRLAANLRRSSGDEEKIVDGAGDNLKDLNIGR